MMCFVVLRGYSSRTILNSVNQGKFPDDSVVHSWLTEDSGLKFHEWTDVNFTDHLFRAVHIPTTNKPQQQTTRYFLFCKQKPQACSDWAYRVDLLPIPIYIEAKFGPSENRIKQTRLTSLEIKFFRRTPGTPVWPLKALRNFGRLGSRTSFRKIRRYKSN